MAGRDWRVFGRRSLANAYLYVMSNCRDWTLTLLRGFPKLAALRARLDNGS